MKHSKRSMRFPRACSLLVFVLLATATTLASQTANLEVPKGRNVLLVASGTVGRPTINRIIQALQEELLAQNVKVQAASVDLAAEGDPHLKDLQDQWLRARYGSSQFNLIIAFGDAPLVIATELRDEMWPKTPIVFFGVDKAFQLTHIAPLTTGIIATPDWAENLQLAQQLFPNLEHVALTGGSTESDHRMNEPLVKLVREQYPAISLIDLTNLLLPQQIDRVQQLPPNTVIMFGLPTGDASGNASVPLRGGFRDTLTRKANSPVFFIYDSNFSSGGLGGYMSSTDDLGREAADLGLSILAGKISPDAAPITTRSIHLRLDWREIQRWKIPLARVPKNASIEFVPPTLWKSHADAVTVAGGALAAQFLLISFLIVERRRRQKSQELLAERLRFEETLTLISSKFAHSSNDDPNSAIEECLRTIQLFFRSRTVSIWESTESDKSFLRSYVWPKTERINRSSRLAESDFPDTVKRLLQNENVIFSNESERDNLEDGAAFRKADIRSYLAVPLHTESRIFGCISLANFDSEISINTEIISRFRVIADIVGNALARRANSTALRESESLKFSLLQSMPSSVAVVDQSGSVLAINQHWIDLSTQSHISLQPQLDIGSNYVEICLSMRDGDEAAAGMQSVLSGKLPLFEMEYDNDAHMSQKWFRMTVIPLPRSTGGAVITHLDITQQKLVEIEEQKLKEQLIHLNRSSEMGQLAASLAHELAQPIAAALSNAQAALRLVDRPEPDLTEMTSALKDIVEDEQRAGAVLTSIRSILKRRPTVAHPINLNEIVFGVTAIIKNNAQSRNVQITLHISQEPVMVMGDEIPLQQVLLNLANNAMDSMKETPNDSKVLTIRTETQRNNATGLLIVEDEGQGLDDKVMNHLFSPFFTTKSDGLGMGLAICRTILQSHGGSITCHNRPHQGASFRVEVPLAL